MNDNIESLIRDYISKNLRISTNTSGDGITIDLLLMNPERPTDFIAAEKIDSTHISRYDLKDAIGGHS